MATADQIPGLGLNCSPDFDSLDFYPEDWHTSVDDFGVDFSVWMFARLPAYFKNNDTYKDANGEGILERYLATLGYELDENIVSQIPCYLKIIDPTECQEIFLSHISDVLGNPPDIFNDITLYRKLLNYIVAVYKIKGTIAAYQLFFSLLGYNVTITEVEPINSESEYDIEGEYDTGLPESLYDNSRCNPCSTYHIRFYPKDINNLVLTPDLVERLKVGIEFNEPINAYLNTFTFAISLEDGIEVGLTDDMNWDTEEVKQYDLGVDEYDEDPLEDYDNELLIGAGTILTSVTFTSVLNSSEYEIELELQNNFAPETLDILNSLLTVKGLDSEGEVIYQVSGTLINNTLNGSNPVGEVVESSHNMGTPSSIHISGQLKLSDDKVASIDTSINLIGDTIIEVFFI